MARWSRDLVHGSIEPRPRVEVALLRAAVESYLQCSHPTSQWMDVRTSTFVFLSPSASETLSRWRPQFFCDPPTSPLCFVWEGLLLRSRTCAGLLFAFFYVLLPERLSLSHLVPVLYQRRVRATPDAGAPQTRRHTPHTVRDFVQSCAHVDFTAVRACDARQYSWNTRCANARRDTWCRSIHGVVPLCGKAAAQRGTGRGANKRRARASTESRYTDMWSSLPTVSITLSWTHQMLWWCRLAGSWSPARAHVLWSPR